MIRDALILLLFFGLIWGIFAWVFPRNKASDGWITKEQENKIAEVLTEYIEKQFNVMEENEWQASLDSMLLVMHAHIDQPKEITYTVKVLDSSTPNAFATLGGNIYFFRGILEMAEHPEEIAAILAHEMGHIEHDHVIKRLISEFGITVLLGILTGGDLIALKEILRTLSSGAFSRKQEREADDFALRTMYNAGISPRHLGVIFKRLRETLPDNMPDMTIISSHPSIDSRIKKSFEYDLSEFQEVNYRFPWPGMEYDEEIETEETEVELMESD